MTFWNSADVRPCCMQVVKQQALERQVQLLEQHALASQAALAAAVSGRALSLPGMPQDMRARLLAGVAGSPAAVPGSAAPMVRSEGRPPEAGLGSHVSLFYPTHLCCTR